MRPPAHWKDLLFDATRSFDDITKYVYEFQLKECATYSEYLSLLTRHIEPAHRLTGYPFLPIGLFRNRRVLARGKDAALYFESSGTTAAETSRHYVADPDLYHRSIDLGFHRAFGPVTDYAIYALLPSYLDRQHASLVYMAERLIRRSGCGGFYRFEYSRLLSDLANCPDGKRPLLIGVSFALWEMAEQYAGTDLSHVTVVETGGMKGRRREIVREELHGIIGQAFGVASVHSEYGMTELLSQAWSPGNGIFYCPPWMRVLVRDPYDPFHVSESGRGALNIIDLANVYSCSFLATQDVGEVFQDGSFRVDGRLDNSQLRGCNLLFD